MRLSTALQQLRDGESSPVNLELLGEYAYQGVHRAKFAIGVARIRMGAALCALEETGAWRGRTSAKSFTRFLRDEGIEPAAGRQYMAVARAFVIELGCAEHQVEQLARASMRTLVVAARVATRDNLSEVIEIVSFMPRPEAIESLNALAGDAPDTHESESGQAYSRPVSTILDKVGDLTLEQRAELYSRLRVGEAPARKTTA